MIMTLAEAIKNLQNELESGKYNLETLISISYFTEERVKSIGKQILHNFGDAVTQSELDSEDFMAIITEIDESQVKIEDVDDIIENYIRENLYDGDVNWDEYKEY